MSPCRSIVHLDADAFFASVEQAADARLRGKPIAVGGEKRGIIASASYEARKFGIYTPMPTVVARRLCPKLILLPGDFEKYELFSRLMFSYAYDFTPDVEIGSIDEGYFDLTGVRKPVVGIAETIRQAIRQALKLSVSEGIAGNKLVSQIASKLKKPAAFHFVAAGTEAEFLSPLANKWLPGVGPRLGGQLNAAGLAYIGQIAGTPVELLGLLTGSMAPQLRNFARGIDERPVIPARAPAKSYSEQETFDADTTDEEFLQATLRRMADKLMVKVREDHKSIRTLTVKIRYNDMDEQQASESLEEPTDLETDTYFKTSALLRKAWQRRVSLRLVSLKLSNIYEGRFWGGLALDASARRRDGQQRLADVVDQLQQKFGRGVVMRGHDFVLRSSSGLSAEKTSPASKSVRHSNPERIPPTNFSRIEPPNQGVTVERITPCAPGLIGCGDGAHGVTRPTLRFVERVASPRRHLPRGESSESPTSYQAAIVQRQRLGNYAARQLALAEARQIGNPSPELRLRVRLASQEPRSAPVLGRSDVLTHECSRNSQPPCQHPIAAPGTGALRGKTRIQSKAGHLAQSIPLNVHSYYSFLDSTLSPKAIVDLAKRHKLPAIALTDKNNLHGAVEFAQAATEAGIKPIIGAEVEWDGWRVCLYVENQQGYRNLCRILNARGRRPEVRGQKSEGGSIFASFDYTDGLIAVSADPTLAPFFPGSFYLEANSLEAFDKRPAPLPCVASFPVHYELPTDRWKYDIIQSIRTLTLLHQAHPEKDLEGDYHFHTGAEMQKLFMSRPELIAHSSEIAERCSFAFSLGQPQFPGYDPPSGFTAATYLRKLVMDGLHRRYPKDHARLKPQLEQELAIITDVGYEEYFLVMWDILQECRRRGIEWITRGSAADSLACYCLEISGVCPIRFDLYFRRFLNKDRMALNKLPDIDVDFPHDRKDDVIDLIFEKFGPEHTAIVGGFSTFQSRSAFAGIAKVLGVSEFQVRRITERLPHFSRASELAEAVAITQECRDLPFQEEPYRTALLLAALLDGFPRYPKMHPCGLVLSRQSMEEITPCFISAKGYPTTHFDMDSIEAVGLVKMDILAQGGLAVMRDVALELTRAYAGRGRRPSPRPSPPGEGETFGRACQNRRPVVVEGLTKAFTSSQASFRKEAAANSSSPRTWFRKTSAADAPSPGAEGEDELSTNTYGVSAAGENDAFLQQALNLNTLEPWKDPQVWELIAGGNARAVHHIESPAMISLCKMCNVHDIDTLIAIVSVIRPGAANENKKMEFARRYQRLSPIQYPHPLLKTCLRSTYGLVVYEEHILQICEAFAGLPPGRADVLRRALGKHKIELIDQIQTEFAECARQRGRTEPDIARVWELVSGFSGYAFCKAHSTAYGVEAYQSAWLKRYYPVEFMAAVLTNGKGFYAPLVYVLECHRLRIPLLPPSVNEPGPAFTLSRMFSASKIRVPVLNVKGLTIRTKEAILNERQRAPFSSLTDFFLRVRPLPEEMESLIRAGAFDEFGARRTAQYWEFKSLCASRRVRPSSGAAAPTRAGSRKFPGCFGVLDVAAPEDGRTPSIKQEECGVFNPPPPDSMAEPSQLTLFPCSNLDSLTSVPLAEPDRLQRLRAEEELLGYPVTGHPLELFPDIAWETYCPLNQLGSHLGEQIVTCGLVIEQRLFHQVTGEPMKFLTIADWTGMVETELFARTYKSCGLNTVRYRVLEITARVEPFENSRGYTLRVLRAGKPRQLSKLGS